MFERALRGIRDRVEGTLAISLLDLDGIAIASLPGGGVPLEVFGAEFGRFVKSIRPNEELDTGEVQQFALVTDKYITFLSALTPEYFVLLVMKPDGNYGRARFELAKARELLRDELT